MSSETYTGNATYYYLTGGVTACGTQHSDEEFVCALNSQQFDSTRPCGRTIRVTGSNGTRDVTIVDRMASGGVGDIDLSPAAFKSIVGSLSIGRSNVNWRYV